jgi:hypothetical protein
MLQFPPTLQNVKRTKQLYPFYRLDRQMFSVSVVHKLYQHAAKKMAVGRNVIDGIRKIVKYISKYPQSNLIKKLT